MKVKFNDRESYHKNSLYKNLSDYLEHKDESERRYYSFLKCHEEFIPNVWYDCEFAGFMWDHNLTKIVSMYIDIKSELHKTGRIRLRVDMKDIYDKFVEFVDFQNLCCDDLVVKIANMQSGCRYEDDENEGCSE